MKPLNRADNLQIRHIFPVIKQNLCGSKRLLLHRKCQADPVDADIYKCILAAFSLLRYIKPLFGMIAVRVTLDFHKQTPFRLYFSVILKKYTNQRAVESQCHKRTSFCTILQPCLFAPEVHN